MTKPRTQLISLTHDEAIRIICSLRSVRHGRRERDLALADRLAAECAVLWRGERAPISRTVARL